MTGKVTLSCHDLSGLTSWTPGSGITHLGIPIDHPTTTSFSDKVWDEALSSLQNVCDRLGDISDGQIAHFLLRHCDDAAYPSSCKPHPPPRLPNSWNGPIILFSASSKISSINPSPVFNVLNVAYPYATGVVVSSSPPFTAFPYVSAPSLTSYGRKTASASHLSAPQPSQRTPSICYWN